MDAQAVEDARRGRVRAIRAKYAERYRAQSKEWRSRNPDRVKANNDKKPRKTDRRARVAP